MKRVLLLSVFALASFATVLPSSRPLPRSPKSDPAPIPVCGGKDQPPCPPGFSK